MLPELHYVLFGKVDHVPSSPGHIIRGMSAPEMPVVTGSTLDRILQFLKEVESTSLPELVAGTGSARSAIQAQLRNLAAAGKIETIAKRLCHRVRLGIQDVSIAVQDHRYNKPDPIAIFLYFGDKRSSPEIAVNFLRIG